MAKRKQLTNYQQYFLEDFSKLTNKMNYLVKNSKKYVESDEKISSIKEFIHDFVKRVREKQGLTVSNLKTKFLDNIDNLYIFYNNLSDTIFISFNENQRGVFFLLNPSGIITYTCIFDHEIDFSPYKKESRKSYQQHLIEAVEEFIKENFKS